MSKPASVSKADPAAIAFEVALGYHTPEEICLKFDITQTQLESIKNHKDFKKAVTLYKREIDEEGTQFRLKARKLAFIVLNDLYSIATDPSAENSDRVAAIKEIARYAGYEKSEAPKSDSNAFVVNIDLRGRTE